MVRALKVENTRKMDITQFIVYALNKFRQADHTQPYEPAKIEISPQDKKKLPAAFSIPNIPVVENPELKPGFSRVVTQDIEGLED